MYIFGMVVQDKVYKARVKPNIKAGQAVVTESGRNVIVSPEMCYRKGKYMDVRKVKDEPLFFGPGTANSVITWWHRDWLEIKELEDPINKSIKAMRKS